MRKYSCKRILCNFKSKQGVDIYYNVSNLLNVYKQKHGMIFHSYEISRIDKYREIESKLLRGRGWAK